MKKVFGYVAFISMILMAGFAEGGNYIMAVACLAIFTFCGLNAMEEKEYGIQD